MKFVPALCVLAIPAFAASQIDLAGKWDFQFDSTGEGSTVCAWTNGKCPSIHLPGTLSQAGQGTPLALEPVLPVCLPEHLSFDRGLMFSRPKDYANAATPLLHLYQRYSYVGPVFYRRFINIPHDWRGMDVELEFERALWKTQLWINGHFVGVRNSLVAPHRYDVGPFLKAGRNELVLRVDNSRQVAIGNPHAYTEESQTIWNGVIGKMLLTAHQKVRVDRLDLRPDLSAHCVRVTVALHNGESTPRAKALVLQASPENFSGKTLPPLMHALNIPVGDSEATFCYPMGDTAERWSEFTPELYRMTAHFENERGAVSSDFGYREFRRDGRGLTINGKPVFLRGTVECCVFPKTGYPDMRGKEWEKIFSVCKACGLNHMRFHTWCPPEAAFEIADRKGFYLEVELPNWCFQMGKDPATTQFFRDEGRRMIREYGNHPSWVMFTMGNELKGDYAVLDDLIADFRRYDSNLLYASTTYPSSKRGKIPGALDDYYISQDTPLGRVRGQDILNDDRPNTVDSYDRNASDIRAPLIAHEVGQYCVYPRMAEIPNYDGVLRPLAFEAIRNDLSKKGRLNDAHAYTHNSGKLAALLYKEEVERALRTTNQAGFQLLQLNDFPGQGTSTVGLFDSFWNAKHVISPAEFHEFCAPVTPLLLLPKRVFDNDEALRAQVEIVNFGPEPLHNQRVHWTVIENGNPFASGDIAMTNIELGARNIVGEIAVPLSSLRRASHLNVTVSIPETSVVNNWSVWVYPAESMENPSNNISIFNDASPDFYSALAQGKRVLLLASPQSLVHPLAVQFTTVFWNPIMFPNQPGTMGALIDKQHPVFADFPTESWSDWQWWDLFHHATGFDLADLPSSVTAPLRFIDKFNRNAIPAAILEARVGAGKLLMTTLDIRTDLQNRPVARQLRQSILNYMAKSLFKPQGRVSAEALKKLFKSFPPLDK